MYTTQQGATYKDYTRHGAVGKKTSVMYDLNQD
jgi:hypothetical protein